MVPFYSIFILEGGSIYLAYIICQFKCPNNVNTQGTYRDKLEDLIEEEDWCAQIQYGLPLDPVERSNGEQRL